VGRLESVVEQVSASAGNFLFFLIAARMLGAEEYGVFSVYLIAAQLIHGVALQWIILPITTTQYVRKRPLGGSVTWRRVSSLIVASPLFALLYASLIMPTVSTIWFVLNVTAIAAGLTIADTLRYACIRANRAALQIGVNLFRLFVALTVLYQGAALGLLRAELAIAAMSLGFIPSIALLLALSNTPHPGGGEQEVQGNSKADPGGDSTQSHYFRTLLWLGIANSAYTIVTTYALSLAGVAALGAIQAFRSLVNWAPLALQFLETHFAASLTRNRRRAFLDKRWLQAFAVGTALGLAILVLYGREIITLTIGADFVQYHWILVALFLLVMIQSATRTMSIEARLQVASKVLSSQTQILSVASVFLAVWAMVGGGSLIALELVAAMIVVAICQGMSMTYQLKKYAGAS